MMILLAPGSGAGEVSEHTNLVKETPQLLICAASFTAIICIQYCCGIFVLSPGFLK